MIYLDKYVYVLIHTIIILVACTFTLVVAALQIQQQQQQRPLVNTNINVRYTINHPSRFTKNRPYLKPWIKSNYQTIYMIKSTSDNMIDEIHVSNTTSHTTTITSTTSTNATTTATTTTTTNNEIKSSIDINHIQWIIRPCENPTIVQMIQWYISGIQTLLFQKDRNTLYLIPQLHQANNNNHNNNNMIVLFAKYNQQIIGRFGFIHIPGSISPPPLINAVQRIYNNNNNNNNKNDNVVEEEFINAGAIIYMFIEPMYRGNTIGSIALQIIHSIQRSYGCDYNILVANDKSNSNTGSGDKDNEDDSKLKLVQWYKRNGYSIAPELQDMLGSPNGIYGIAMIASTSTTPRTTTIADTTITTNNNNISHNKDSMKNITSELTTISNIKIQWW